MLQQSTLISSETNVSYSAADTDVQVNSPQPIGHFVLNGVCYPVSRDLAAGLTDVEFERIRGILIHNVASQRAHRVMAKYLAGGKQLPAATPATAPDTAPEIAPAPAPVFSLEQWEQYQRQVIHTYRCERSRHDALQEGDIDSWHALARQLTHAAQRMLVHSGACSEYAREQAAELSQQACAHICAASFPWDVSFDLWAYTIVHNVFLQRYTRSHDVLDRMTQVNDTLEFEEFCGHPGSTAALNACVGADQAVLSADELIEAIQQMRSQRQRAVIVYTYYEELSDEEIAEAIGRSRSVVQTLRHRALNRLRTTLCPE